MLKTFSFNGFQGRVDEYIDSRNPKNGELKKIAVQVAKLMAGMHGCGDSRFSCDSLKSQIKRSFSTIDFQKVDHGLHARVTEAYHKALEIVKTSTSPIGVCHNDLHCKNILVTKNGKERVYLIDFEFSGLNLTDYDVGNYSAFNNLCPAPKFGHFWRFSE